MNIRKCWLKMEFSKEKGFFGVDVTKIECFGSKKKTNEEKNFTTFVVATEPSQCRILFKEYVYRCPTFHRNPLISTVVIFTVKWPYLREKHRVNMLKRIKLSRHRCVSDWTAYTHYYTYSGRVYKYMVCIYTIHVYRSVQVLKVLFSIAKYVRPYHAFSCTKTVLHRSV